MTIKSIIKSAVFAAVTIAVATVSMSQVSAAQIDPSDPNAPVIKTPVFNTYTNVPSGVGNEADFVKLRKSNGDGTVPATQNAFIDPVNAVCTVGEKFDVRTYVHNGANEQYNNNGSGSAVAHNVNVAMQAPLGSTSNKFTFSSTISASNAASKTDTGVLNCQNNVRLKLVPQTVKVYSKFTGWNGAADSAVNGNLKIGSRATGSGDVWGCWEDRVVVVYTVVVEKATVITPEVRCDAIVVEKLGKLRYRYNVRYTATNGATLKTVRYNFGDNSNQTVAAPFTAEHTYAAAGEYRVTTELTFAIPGQADKVITDAKCATTIKTDVEKPCPTNPKYPEGSPECEPCPTKPEYPKNSKECEEVPVTSIPKTGLGNMLSGLVGSSAAGYGGYALYQKRRALKNQR